MQELKGRHTHELSLSGNVVLPGFTDSHVHFIDGGLQVLATNCCTPIDMIHKLYTHTHTHEAKMHLGANAPDRESERRDAQSAASERRTGPD